MKRVFVSLGIAFIGVLALGLIQIYNGNIRIDSSDEIHGISFRCGSEGNSAELPSQGEKIQKHSLKATSFESWIAHFRPSTALKACEYKLDK